MLDITSWVREKIFRRPELIKVAPGEELSEKQTTKLGYFLLVCMFLAIISTAQWSLSIIKDIPTRPTVLPQCVQDMVSFFTDKNIDSYDSYSYNYYGYEYNGYNSCILVGTNPDFDFTNKYNSLLSPYNKARAHAETINRLSSQLLDVQNEKDSTQREYDSSLNEDQINSASGIYDTENLGARLARLNSQEVYLQGEIDNLKKSIEDIRSAQNPEIGALKGDLETAQDKYDSAYIWFKIYRSLLSLIFIAIIFTLLYRIYVRCKLRNSPYTIIFSIATFAYGLVLLQLFCLFLWDILPHKLLEVLLGWISLFTPLIFLLQFIWPIVIVGIFGYLVYRIQKRLYSPQNVLKRFVKDEKCPNCGNAVDITKPFCPLCAEEIHIHCHHCKSLTMKGMPYCSTCGKALKNTPPIK